MTVMVRNLFPSDLRAIIKKWFGDEYNDYAPIYTRIFEVLSDNRAFVENALVSGLPLLQQKDEAGPIRYASGKQGYVPRYDHIEMALGFQISQNLIDDGVALDVAERMAKSLKRSAMQTDEILAHQVLNRAFTASGAGLMVGGDGTSLCSTAHAIRGNGSITSFSNRPAVDTDLSEAALEQAVIDICNLVDDRGNRIYVKPTKLVTHINEQFNAHRILKSPLRVGTTDNDANALRDMNIVDEVIKTPYLTDTSAWFLLTDAPDGLKFYDRKAATIDSDNDFDTNSGKYKVTRRMSCGWDDSRGIYGSSGA